MGDTVRLTTKALIEIDKKVMDIESTKPFIYGDDKFGNPIDMALTDFWFDVMDSNYIIHYLFNIEKNELISKFYDKYTKKHATTKHKDFIIGWGGKILFEFSDQYFTEDSDHKIKEDLSTVISVMPDSSPEPLRGKKITRYTAIMAKLETLCKSFLCLPSVWKRATLTVKKNENTPEDKLLNAIFVKREVRLRNVYTIKSGISIKNIKPSKHLTCPCWGVRGHYRHLANGKVIFVKPYKKGKQRDKEELQVNKDYVSATHETFVGE